MANYQMSQSHNFTENNNFQMWAPSNVEPPPFSAQLRFSTPPPPFTHPVQASVRSAPPPPPFTHPVQASVHSAPPPPFTHPVQASVHSAPPPFTHPVQASVHSAPPPPPPPPPGPPPSFCALHFTTTTGKVPEPQSDWYHPTHVPQQISQFQTPDVCYSYQETSNCPDKDWVELFLSRRRTSLQQPRTLQKGPKIHEAEEMLKSCLRLLDDLEVTHRNLLSTADTISSSEWKTEIDIIDKKKADVKKKLQKLHDPVVLNSLKVSVDRRRKKRISQKRQKENWKFVKAEKNAQRQKRHREIDTWLEKMQESVERAKMEESLKIEADAVLSDVTKKKAEARRQLALLSALARLRKLRAQTAVARGEKVSSELEACFSRVIDNLKSLWEEKLEEYTLEEKGLRVMLTEAVDERKVKYDRSVLAQWKKLLFGPQQSQIHPFYLSAERNVQNFVSIRWSWDKCLASPNAPMSSAIPIGWVLPTNPSSGAWEKLLSFETQDD